MLNIDMMLNHTAFLCFPSVKKATALTPHLIILPWLEYNEYKITQHTF